MRVFADHTPVILKLIIDLSIKIDLLKLMEYFVVDFHIFNIINIVFYFHSTFYKLPSFIIL